MAGVFSFKVSSSESEHPKSNTIKQRLDIKNLKLFFMLINLQIIRLKKV